jgi:hypothetical protein
LNQRVHGIFPFPAILVLCDCRPEEAKIVAGKSPPVSGPLNAAEFGKNLANLSKQFAASANRTFEFQKWRRLFIRMQHEMLVAPPIFISSSNHSNLHQSKLRFTLGNDASGQFQVQ